MTAPRKLMPKLWEDDYILWDDSEQPIYLDSPNWLEWLGSHDSFRYETELPNDRSFTARKEKGKYWYAYKKVSGKLRKKYIGTSSDINTTRLTVVSYELTEQSVTQPKKRLHNEVCNPINEQVQNLEKEVNDYQSKLAQIVEVVRQRRQDSKQTRNWVEANKILDSLESLLSDMM